MTFPGNKQRQADWNQHARKRQIIVNVMLMVLLALFVVAGIGYVVMARSQ